MIDVPCNLCGRNDWRVRIPATMNEYDAINVDVFRCTSPAYGNHAQIVQCNYCQLVYANPRWPAEQLESAYQEVEDETYLHEWSGRKITFENHLDALQSLTGPANGRSLLDVGAYTGVFVDVAQRAGWNAFGIEPSEWAVAQARKRGLPVFQGTQDAQALNGLKFDVITLWDVIEHVADPTGELQKSYNLLKPGGWLAVHTMDINSLTARLMGSRWPWFMDMHLYYFSQKSLAKLLKKCGFEVIWSGAQGRYLRLGYLATRLHGFYAPLGKIFSGLIHNLQLDEIAVPVNFGDLFTVYARRN